MRHAHRILLLGSLAGGQPPWRYSDPYRKAIRIHTKHIATEPA